MWMFVNGVVEDMLKVNEVLFLREEGLKRLFLQINVLGSKRQEGMEGWTGRWRS